MTSLEGRYLSWLTSLTWHQGLANISRYSFLINKLFETEYIPLHARDVNRAADGIELRYQFGLEKDISDELISSEIDTRPCSILEMMLALADHIESDIMYDPSDGENIGRWFWEMIYNLGLWDQDNNHYNEKYVNDILTKFNNGEYAENGEGGLFPMDDPSFDVRQLELWDQMNRYIVAKYY
jgi:hypothetical protein